MEPTPTRIVFYDGNCGLCHALVRWVLKRDRRKKFLFAPLGGKTFHRLLGGGVAPDIRSVVFWNAQAISIRSSAIVSILSELHGGWPILGRMFGLLPSVLRDAGYNLVAKIRGRIFPRPDGSCPLVPPEQRDQLIE